MSSEHRSGDATRSDRARPGDPRVAARAATVIAYGVVLVGVAAGTVALRGGDLVVAITTWAATLAMGATLTGIATLLRSMASLSARLTTLTRAIEDLRADVSSRGRW